MKMIILIHHLLIIRAYREKCITDYDNEMFFI